MSVKVIPLEQGNLTKAYRRKTTRRFDKLYGLDGQPLSKEQESYFEPYGLGMGDGASMAILNLFLKVTKETGNVVGLIYDELDFLKEGRDSALRNGWLETYEHKGVKVVELSNNYFARIFEVRGLPPLKSQSRDSSS